MLSACVVSEKSQAGLWDGKKIARPTSVWKKRKWKGETQAGPHPRRSRKG